MTARIFTLMTALCLSPGCDTPSAGDLGEKEPEEPTASVGADVGVEADAPCDPSRPQGPAPRLMFVLDKSSSMGAGTRESAPPLLGRPSRWARAHALVEELTARVEGEAQFGALLFPSRYADVGGDAVACDVLDVPDLPVGPYTSAQLVERLPAADTVDFAGGSPATQAMWTALHSLLAQPSGGAKAAIVLVTDGGANCADEDAPLAEFDADLADVVAFARDTMEIPTFVVAVDPADAVQAIPAVNPREALAALARAGGAAHPETGFYAVDDADGVLAAISARLGVGAPATDACP